MLDKIIDSCNYVVNNSKNVKINYEKLDNFIKLNEPYVVLNVITGDNIDESI